MKTTKEILMAEFQLQIDIHNKKQKIEALKTKLAKLEAEQLQFTDKELIEMIPSKKHLIINKGQYSVNNNNNKTQDELDKLAEENARNQYLNF